MYVFICTHIYYTVATFNMLTLFLLGAVCVCVVNIPTNADITHMVVVLVHTRWQQASELHSTHSGHCDLLHLSRPLSPH